MAGVVGAPYPGPQPYSVFRSVRVPMDAFTAVNPDLDLASLDALLFRFRGRPAGRVLIDDIEVTS